MNAPERDEMHAMLKERSAEIQAGESDVLYPKSHAFEDVNHWVHHDDPSIDELGWLCLGLATALEKAWDALRLIAAKQGEAPAGFPQRAMAEIAKQALIDTKAP